MNQNRPFAWTIAGSDSSGAAGIQMDLKVFQALNVHAASIITALTEQNLTACKSIYYLENSSLLNQMSTLQKDFTPQVIKIGMLGKAEIADFLAHYKGYSVLDPVMFTSSNQALFTDSLQHYLQQVKKIAPFLSVITPNIPEAEHLTGISIHTPDDIIKAARVLRSFGTPHIVIKGGHYQSRFSFDYYLGPHHSIFFNSVRDHCSFRGTGCLFASAIAAYLAHGHNILDALVLAKMYLNQNRRLNSSPLFFPTAHQLHQAALPYSSLSPLWESPPAFPKLKTIGLYPIVDNSAWFSRLLPQGVKTIQLRIKDQTAQYCKQEIAAGIAAARSFKAQLFVNDYWETALSQQAFGVHLGQEDIEMADSKTLVEAGLHLGISTHSYFELSRAYTYQPSYYAFGPIFPTQTKAMPFKPQGLEKLKALKSWFFEPVVAIGGIDLSRFETVCQTGVEGVAVLSAITQATHPAAMTQAFLDRWKPYDTQ